MVAFFYRESHRRIAAERACQRRVGGLGCWCLWPGLLFLQGEPQEIAYRDSLSEALGVLDALVIKVWTVGRLERKLRDHYGLIRSTEDAFTTSVRSL